MHIRIGKLIALVCTDFQVSLFRSTNALTYASQSAQASEARILEIKLCSFPGFPGIRLALILLHFLWKGN
jgi:hypothetical protein